MNGAEHYAEAERLLADAALPPSERSSAVHQFGRAQLIAAAQVHATLALTRAVVEAPGGMP
ncbi:hypothetical protein GCM10023340_38630 [Nocardioides marinquilinus]|uniref:Uncharacterized protein n=1 Tax=Nocardioides marinquilinus TaxID=1210400 RepID=A0ABP9PZF4_9ACTN